MAYGNDEQHGLKACHAEKDAASCIDISVSRHLCRASLLMRLIKTMELSSNQGRVCQLRRSNSSAIASICNAESAEKTRF